MSWVTAYTFSIRQPVGVVVTCSFCGSSVELVPLESNPDDGPGMGSYAQRWVCTNCEAAGPVEELNRELIIR